MHVIEFFGPPTSGKTTLTSKVMKELDLPSSCLCYGEEKKLDPHITLGLQFKAKCFLLALFIASVQRSPIAVFSDFVSWRKWAQRASREWLMAFAWRKVLLTELKDKQIIISDSRFFSKFLFEIADPRNVCETELFSFFLRWLKALPNIVDIMVISLRTDSSILLDRANKRQKNKVRKELDLQARNLFLSNSLSVQLKIEQELRNL